MDLKKAEKTLKELEENSIKVKQVGKAVEKFKEIQEELESLPEKIEEKSDELHNRITNFERDLTKKHEKILKDLENLKKFSKDVLTKNSEAFEQFKEQNAKEKAFLKKELKSLENNLNTQQKILGKSVTKIQADLGTTKFLTYVIYATLIIFIILFFSYI